MSTFSTGMAGPLPVLSAGVTAEVNRPFHIPSLDGIRGVAFLCVFLAHCGLGWVIPGGFGVTIFFALSGFLITTLLRLEIQETGRVDLKAFYLRRIFRILPLFYFVIAVATLLRWAGLLGGGLDATAVDSQVFHWTNYYLMHHADRVVDGMQVYWSLAIEEHFYLLFPPLFLFMQRYLNRCQQGILLVALCILCLVWRCVTVFLLHWPLVHNELGTETRFDGILFGCLLAMVANPALDSAFPLGRKRLGHLAILGLVALVYTFVCRNEVFRFTLRYTVQGFALLPIFAYVVQARGTRVFYFLNSRAITYLGVLSYALYLVHYIVLKSLKAHIHVNSATMAFIAFPLALLIAKILQISIERPMLRLRKRFSRVHA